MHDPLTNTGGQVFLGIGEDGANDRDDQGGECGELENGQTIVSNGRYYQGIQPAVLLNGLGPDYIVQNNLEGLTVGTKSAAVSPITARNAKASAFECGRNKSPILSVCKV